MKRHTKCCKMMKLTVWVANWSRNLGLRLMFGLCSNILGWAAEAAAAKATRRVMTMAVFMMLSGVRAGCAVMW